MIKTLLKSVREYKTASILCPIVQTDPVMHILHPVSFGSCIQRFLHLLWRHSASIIPHLKFQAVPILTAQNPQLFLSLPLFVIQSMSNGIFHQGL